MLLFPLRHTSIFDMSCSVDGLSFPAAVSAVEFSVAIVAFELSLGLIVMDHPRMALLTRGSKICEGNLGMYEME